MGKIANEETSAVAFKLTFQSMLAMLSYPVEKKIDYKKVLVDGRGCLQADVKWWPSMNTMTIWSEDEGRSFMVLEADTDEVKCKIEEGAEYALYVIDVE